MDITQVSSRVVYENHWMRVREDGVAFADGRPGVYGVVDKADSALVIPAERDGFHLVEQYRYPLGRRCWEFPQGSSDDGDGDTAETARRELAEETGLVAGRVVRLGRIAVAPGFCSQTMDVFVATDMHAGPPRRDRSEQDMRLGFVHHDELAAMIADGRLEDSSSIAAYGLLVTAGRDAHR
jgi:8-oxo-dGTP pyrophosphatase MutT (NUDIX family)